MFKIKIPGKTQWKHVCEIRDWLYDKNIQNWDLHREGIQWLFEFEKLDDAMHFLLRFGGSLLQDELVT